MAQCGGVSKNTSSGKGESGRDYSSLSSSKLRRQRSTGFDGAWTRNGGGGGVNFPQGRGFGRKKVLNNTLIGEER